MKALLFGFTLMMFSGFAAPEADMIDPQDYKLSCHGEIRDAEADKHLSKSSISLNPKEWPIQIDLADYPYLNQAIWYGPTILETDSFVVRFRAGRTSLVLEVGDNRNQPKHVHNIYHLASAQTDLKATKVVLSYSYVFREQNVVKLSDVFAECVLTKK